MTAIPIPYPNPSSNLNPTVDPIQWLLLCHRTLSAQRQHLLAFLLINLGTSSSSPLDLSRSRFCPVFLTSDRYYDLLLLIWSFPIVGIRSEVAGWISQHGLPRIFWSLDCPGKILLQFSAFLRFWICLENRKMRSSCLCMWIFKWSFDV